MMAMRKRFALQSREKIADGGAESGQAGRRAGRASNLPGEQDLRFRRLRVAELAQIGGIRAGLADGGERCA
jgi:hypothetical protein